MQEKILNGIFSRNVLLLFSSFVSVLLLGALGDSQGVNLVLSNMLLYIFAFGLCTFTFVTLLYEDNNNTYLRHRLNFMILVQILLLYMVPVLIYGSPRFFSSIKYYEATKSISSQGQIHPNQIWIHQFWGALVFLSVVIPGPWFAHSSVLLSWFPLFAIILVTMAIKQFLLPLFFNDQPKLEALTIWIFLSINWVDQTYWNSQIFGFILFIFLLGIFNRYLELKQEEAFLTSYEDIKNKRTEAMIYLILGIISLQVMIVTHPLSLLFTVTGIFVLFATYMYPRRDWKVFFTLISTVFLGILIFVLSDPCSWIRHRIENQISPTSSVVESSVTDRYNVVNDIDFYSTQIFIYRFAYSLIIILTAGVLFLSYFVNLRKLGSKSLSWMLAARREFFGRESNSFRTLFAGLIIGSFIVPVSILGYGGEGFLRFLMFSSPFIAVIMVSNPKMFDLADKSFRKKFYISFILFILMFSHGIARFGEEYAQVIDNDDLEVLDTIISNVPAGTMVIGGVYGQDYIWNPNVTVYTFDNVIWNGSHIIPSGFERYRENYQEITANPSTFCGSRVSIGHEMSQYVIFNSANYELNPIYTDLVNAHFVNISRSSIYDLIHDDGDNNVFKLNVSR